MNGARSQPKQARVSGPSDPTMVDGAGARLCHQLLGDTLISQTMRSTLTIPDEHLFSSLVSLLVEE